MYLTNTRCVLVSKDDKPSFKAFEFITNKVYDENFQEPAFSYKFFTGHIKSYTSEYKNDMVFKI